MTEATIDRLGAQGDGIAEMPDGPVFVPYAAPGDRIRLGEIQRSGKLRRAAIAELVFAGPERVAAPCPHFGECGGCSLQHLSDAFVAGWKRQRLIDALAHRGFAVAELEALVQETITVPPASRRRARFVGMHRAGGMTLGFNARSSHRIVPLTACTVTMPAIVGLLPALARLLDGLLKARQGTDVQITACDNGLDVWLTGVDPGGADRLSRLAQFADSHDLARLSVGTPAEALVVRRQPTVSLGGVATPLPPGGFLQPTREGEAVLARTVTDAAADARRVADLYAGLGTFSFALARSAAVHAVEEDAAAVAALTAGRNAAGGRKPGLKPVTVERRNLVRRPLAGQELSGFDAVVFDPPRAGAREQAEALAASAVPQVIAVSCDPGSFSRDARTLVDGGYRLQSLQPLDQFRWSAHVELVAIFRR